MQSKYKYNLATTINELVRDENTSQQIIEKLDELGALNDFWVPQQIKDSDRTSPASVPQRFLMVSPLFQGEVTLIERDGWYGYEDENGEIRLQAKTLFKLSKKVKRYAKG